MSTEQKLVILNYEDLKAGKDLTALVEKAYGPDGLGILAVEGIPNFLQLRKDILEISKKFVQLPDEVKDTLQHKESYYSFGWSHGKEMMKKGVPDFSKGSYYNNPIHDDPFNGDKELIAKYPSFCHPNIWPQEMPEMREAFLAMGKCMQHVGSLVAIQCDNYVNKTYPGAGNLQQVVDESKTHKARMLHYYPLSGDGKLYGDSEDSWCGWHNDHGSITGLVPAMYSDLEGNETPCPDQEAGLYIKARDGSTHRITTRPDMLAFQIGETAQLTSGGLLQATPHCVKGANGEAATKVSRDTFVMFMEPQWDGPVHMPKEVTDEKRAELLARWESFLPVSVPKLSARWQPHMNFAQFSESSMNAYYGY